MRVDGDGELIRLSLDTTVHVVLQDVLQRCLGEQI